MIHITKLLPATQHDFVYSITDDSGFLALIDPDAYRAYVGAAWTPPQLRRHFVREMQARHALVWRTRQENTWRVSVRLQPINLSGKRELIGPLEAMQGRLLLTSYESLTMAAQFADVTLPEPHEADQIVTLPRGVYHCRIMRTKVRPDDVAEDDPARVHWIIELLAGGDDLPVWNTIQ